MNAHCAAAHRRPPMGLFVLLIAVLGAGCASTPRLADYCMPLPEGSVSQMSQDQKRKADQYNIYAVLSNNVYKPADHPEIWVDPDEWEAVCDDQFRKSNAYGLPDCNPEAPGNGLEAKTYLRRPDGRNGQPTELVFVFRGTTSLSDWWCGNFWDCQYGEADTYVGTRIDRYRSTYPGIAIVTTGHSLGGGLAQHVAFCFEGARAVAFNTSPRSHKHDCNSASARDITPAQEQHIEKTYIIRIHQHAEILSPLRHLFSSKNYSDTVYDLTSASLLARHGMTPLAMGLAKIAACPAPEGPGGSFAPAQAGAATVLARTCDKEGVGFQCAR
jgi:hypothetical protein